MPNFDGGHYFLTALIPVRNDGMPQAKAEDTVLERDDDVPVSWADNLRSTLSTLPTALQSPATIHIGIQSPFAKNLHTHLTRFVVVEDPMYNGRIPQDTLYVSIAGVDLMQPQPVDHLSNPYLLWAIEFDPHDQNASEREQAETYLRELWTQMEEALRAIFISCYGFEARVKDADSFARYILDCQVETTMPFNDYWITSPPFPSMSGFFNFYKIPAVLALLAFAGGLFGWLISGLLNIDPLWGLATSSWGWLTCGGFIALISLVLFAYALVMKRAKVPFPTAPNSDLRSILKALYLQRAFADFMIENQGLQPAQLHQNFGRFLAAHEPQNLSGHTQPPGVVG